MEIFNERSHAHIALQFYRHLVDKFGSRGVMAFNHGTQSYAGQRGRRMAQRAIRDGKELTYETYCQYGEWVNTEYIKTEGAANEVILHSESPDYEMEIISCPWHTEFKEMGEIEGGHEYCKYLDESIAHGFNPEMKYLVSDTLHKSKSCIHIVKNAYFDENTDTAKRIENLKPFEYHCAHSFWAYTEVVESIFGYEGRLISSEVLKKLEERYDIEFTEAIIKYKDTNFNVI